MNSETAAYSRDAHELAMSTGASAAAIETLCTREALLGILTDANIESDICEDVCDSCELNSLNALAIASGLLSKDVIAELCFLTKDEAEVCCQACLPRVFQCQLPVVCSVRSPFGPHGRVTLVRLVIVQPNVFLLL